MKKMSKTNPEIYKHRPMFVRRFIVMLALAAAYGVMYISDNLMLTIAAYFVAVAGLDVFTYYGLGIKGSDYADAEQLMADDQTTLEGLDKYASDRRKIRMVSLATGLLVGGITFLVAPAFILHVFCISFFLATIIGLAILKPHYRKNYPVIILRDDRFYNPNSGLKPGFITPGMAALAANGSWPWGPVSPN
jgi:hypothetical protein